MNTINSYEITNKILKKYNIRANKRFGQNFLINDNVLQDIMKVSEVSNKDLVIEIGPGLGNLTEYLIEKAGYMILVEIDNKMIEILNDRFSNKNYTLLNEDILGLDIDKVIEKIENKNNIKYDNVKVIANLPYYITTPIVFKLLQNSKRISDITVMVQKEVAERMVANYKSKAYGILTLMVEYLSVASIQLIVPNDSFIPAPDVTSAVIRLKKEKRYKVSNEELLFKLIHCAFAQRRKKVVNSLESTKFMNMTKFELEELLELNKLNKSARAEELKLEDYINIIEKITK